MCLPYPSTEVIEKPTTKFNTKKYDKETSPFPSELHHHLYDDNPYLRSGYRKLPVGSWKRSFLSIFQWHNETLNIWTHLLPGIYFAYAGIKILLTNEPDNLFFFPRMKLLDFWDQAVFALYMFSAATTFLFSAFYHTFRMNSAKAYHFCLACDIRGILVLLFGSNAIITWFALKCLTSIRNTWIILELFFFVALLIWVSRMIKYRLTNERTVYFALYSFMGFLSVIHRLALIVIQPAKAGGYYELVRNAYFPRAIVNTNYNNWDVYMSIASTCLVTYAVSGFGLVVRSIKFPERFFPYVFDKLGASHQLFHCIVVVGAHQTIAGLWNMYKDGVFGRC